MRHCLNPLQIPVALVAGCLVAGSLGAAEQAQDHPDPVYLFSYFIDNGQDGLHLAWSADGLTWQALKNGMSFLQPRVGNCWAPEIIFDKQRDEYRIFWASTITGRFPSTDFSGKNDGNHRIYSVTTKDFAVFTPAQLYFDPGFNTIDATLLPTSDGVCMFFKDETKLPKPMKNLRLATAHDIAGGFALAPAPITPPGSWLEGPTALRIGDCTYLYADSYTKHHFVALRSRDLRVWEDVSAHLAMPKGIRHGTAFEVKREVLERLLAQDREDAAEADKKR